MSAYSLVPQSSQLAVKPSTSPQAVALLEVGQAFNGEFAFLGCAPMPTMPVRVGDWLIAPAQQDSSPIPARTLKRVQAIYEAGLRPQGFVLVHESPPLLTAPHRPESMPTTKTWQVPQLSPQVKSVLLTTAKALGGLALLSALFPLGMLLVMGAAVTAVDPILIAVTDDNEWIEIDRWT